VLVVKSFGIFFNQESKEVYIYTVFS